MQLRAFAVIVLIAFGAFSKAQAQSIDINLSELSAKFVYSAMLGGQSSGRNAAQIGVLYNEDGSNLAELGILVIDITGTESPNLEFGLGPKLVAATFGNNNTANVALGFLARYKFFRNGRTRLSLSSYYAPKIVSYLDSERHVEGSIKLEYEVLNNAVAYVGYREVQNKVTTFPDNVVIDRGGHFGFEISF